MTFDKQRAWLQGKGITSPLPLAVLDEICGDVDFNHVAKVEQELSIQKDDLKLVPSAAIEERIAQLETFIQSQVTAARAVLSTIATRNVEATMKRTKEQELLTKYKQSVNDLVNTIRAQANKLHSPMLADYANAILRGTK